MLGDAAALGTPVEHGLRGPAKDQLSCQGQTLFAHCPRPARHSPSCMPTAEALSADAAVGVERVPLRPADPQTGPSATNTFVSLVSPLMPMLGPDARTIAPGTGKGRRQLDPVGGMEAGRGACIAACGHAAMICRGVPGWHHCQSCCLNSQISLS